MAEQETNGNDEGMSTPKKVVTVPRTAITYSLYGDSVYVVKPEPVKEGTPPPADAKDAVFVIERRFVKPGQIEGDRVAINEGLQAGEQVVTTGQIKLNSGARVKIDNSQELKPPATLPLQ